MKNTKKKVTNVFAPSILMSLSRNYLPGQVNFDSIERSTGQKSKNKSPNLTWRGVIEG